jgi:hypothetical protein
MYVKVVSISHIYFASELALVALKKYANSSQFHFTVVADLQAILMSGCSEMTVFILSP